MAKRVAELTGAELDYWVARALWPDDNIENIRLNTIRLRTFTPSLDWKQSGLIIESFQIATEPYANKGDADAWAAHMLQVDGDHRVCRLTQYGRTPPEAAMRCYVASKFGDEVGETI